MISKEEVTRLVEEYLQPTDYYLVEVAVSADNRIVVEIDAFDGVAIDFCAALSQYIESKLDREKEDYELEVGSAGLTSPFKVLKQYEKNLGNEVEVLTADGRKVKGILTGVESDHFVVEMEKQVKPEGCKRKMTVKEPVTFAYTDIKTTKYIFRFK